MREQLPMAYYAVPGPDGFPRVCHAIVGLEPENAVPITEEHAAQISADVRAREAASAPVELAGYVTEEKAKALAAEAANRAVIAAFAELAKSTGGSP